MGVVVELRHGDWAEVLGELPPGAPIHHQSLVPWAIHLRLHGRVGGELVLVDEASGRVMARRAVRAPATRAPGGARATPGGPTRP